MSLDIPSDILHEGILNLLQDPNKTINKHSVLLSDHPTSVTLEDDFWLLLKSIAKLQNKSLNRLITEVDNIRQIPLSSSLRLYCLYYLKDKAKENLAL